MVPARLHHLDGLRGWAALAVLLSHLWQSWLLAPGVATRHGLGWIWDIFHLTPLCMIFDGTLAVNVFFVISGIALSYPVLTAHGKSRILAQMAAFRYFRLTIPILLSCLFAFALLQGGLLINIEAEKLAQTGWLSLFYKLEATDFGSMLRFAVYDVYFDYHWKTSWNVALWTMPIELFGSLFLFVFLFVLSSMQVGRRSRILASLAMILLIFLLWLFPFILHINAATVLLLGSLYSASGFFVGHIICELILLERQHSEPNPFEVTVLQGLGLLVIAGALAVLARRGWYNSWPITIYWLPPLLYQVASALIVVVVCFCRPVRDLMSTRLSLFMGRISFPLYLLHIPIIFSLSSWLFLGIAPHLPHVVVLPVLTAVTIGVTVLLSLAFAAWFEEPLLRIVKNLVYGITRRLLPRKDGPPSVTLPAKH